MQCSNNDAASVVARRGVLRHFSLAFLTSAAAATCTPQNAFAESDLFKPNPLTNKGLEQLRIWNQEEADNIKYGGELESGSAKPSGFDQYVDLLQPILIIERELSTVDVLLNNGKPSSKEDYVSLFEQMNTVVSQSIFDKINFKKVFNAFADNIYYADPDRANLYLGGGAEPSSTQSIAYLIRNDVLTSVEDMRAEVQYLLKELAKLKNGEVVSVGEGGLDLEEITRLSKTANEGMVKYLDVVPPKELEAARTKFSKKLGSRLG